MVINHLHVEASTYCNARCPGCPRNAHGVNLPNLFPLQHLSLQSYMTVLAKFPDVRRVNFNGNLGDPMMNPNILELVKASNARCNITTNGSIGKITDFISLAKLGHEITFSIDGLEDTNHLYRQDVEWSKVMERVKAFLDNGGAGTWKWVIFRHNAQQVEQAKIMASALGFQDFIIEDHGRNYFPACTKDGKISHWILPASGNQQPNENFDVEQHIKIIRKPFDIAPPKYNCKVSCEHLTGSVYISASGTVHPCCFQGFDLPDRKSVSLGEFPDIEKTWNTDDVNVICATNCKDVT